MAYINPNIQKTLQAGIAAQLGEVAYPNNNSDDPDDWDNEEKVKFFLWFMKMHHEEDIKGFKAMRDIERSMEREEQLERERQYLEAQRQFIAQQQAMQAQAAQNAYQYNQVSPYGRVSSTQESTKESWWKRLLK